MIALRVIDRFGRKKLLLIGAVGTAVAQAGVALIMGSGQGNEYLLAMLVMFIAFFAFSQGAVIWVYLAEIFPTAVRARGQALGSTTHWLMNALIATVFPMIAAKAHGVPFWFFSACMVVQFFVVSRCFRRPAAWSSSPWSGTAGEDRRGRTVSGIDVQLAGSMGRRLPAVLAQVPEGCVDSGPPRRQRCCRRALTDWPGSA